MSTDEAVYEFHKNSTEKVVAQLTTYKGFRLVDLRVFYLADDGTYRPSKKGLCIGVDLLGELEKAVRELRAFAGEQEE